MSLVWGIDLGGTKIEGVVLEPERFTEPKCRLRLPTEAHLGYGHIIGQIVRVVEEMEKVTGEPRPARIGVGTPGTADPFTGRMKNCNTTALNGQPLPADLAVALGCEVVLANDANCFALAEARLGAAQGSEIVFGVILGTGVGGGLVVNGRVLNGAQGIAGEWGHNLLDPNGVPCYCGRRGCVETVLAGPSLERFYFEQTGEKRRLPEILSRVAMDPAAEATRRHLLEWFGKALAVVVNIVDPHVIVLGGGVGNVPDLLTEGRKELARWVFNDRLGTELRTPTLGDSAGVFGAAMLVVP